MPHFQLVAPTVPNLISNRVAIQEDGTTVPRPPDAALLLRRLAAKAGRPSVPKWDSNAVPPSEPPPAALLTRTRTDSSGAPPASRRRIAVDEDRCEVCHATTTGSGLPTKLCPVVSPPTPKLPSNLAEAQHWAQVDAAIAAQPDLSLRPCNVHPDIIAIVSGLAALVSIYSAEY